MTDQPTVKGKPFAVIRRWKDNPDEFQVLEYFHESTDAQHYLSLQPRHKDYRLEIATWE